MGSVGGHGGWRHPTSPACEADASASPCLLQSLSATRATSLAAATSRPAQPAPTLSPAHSPAPSQPTAPPTALAAKPTTRTASTPFPQVRLRVGLGGLSASAVWS